MQIMGQAKANREIPWPRWMHVEQFEATALLNYLTRPASGPQGPFMRGTQHRDERKSMKSALSVMGLYEGWIRASRSGEREKLDFPLYQCISFTEESVNFLLKILSDMDNASGLTLIDFEERLEILKAGSYVLPDDVKQQVAAAGGKLPPAPLVDVPPAPDPS